jgi:hypothetical protein
MGGDVVSQGGSGAEMRVLVEVSVDGWACRRRWVSWVQRLGGIWGGGLVSRQREKGKERGWACFLENGLAFCWSEEVWDVVEAGWEGVDLGG